MLSASMDRCFSGLIAAVSQFGGDVVFFGGDALFVAFLAEDHERHAVDGAVAMLQTLRQVVPFDTPLGPVRLTMSAGVATGSADLVVGDGPQRPLFVVGPTVSRTARLESKARPGEVRVDDDTASALMSAERRAADDDWIVTKRRPSPPPAEPPSVVTPLDPSAAAEQHLSAALRQRLLRGDAPKEHRHVTVAFVRVHDLDRRCPADRAGVLQRASSVVGDACDNFDVCWVETDVAADGATIVVGGGVPHQHDDDELRVVAAARRIARSDLGDSVSIGVHRGTAFVGDVGHEERRTYAVTGLTTITAARLAGKATPGEVLASTEVIDRLRSHYTAGPERELAVKGRRQPVRAAAVLDLAEAPAQPTVVALVGRRAELAVLEQAVTDMEAGRGAMVEIVGPPGMGKTQLLHAFLASAPAPRLTIAGELALRMVPFGVLAPALRATLGAATARGVGALVAAAGDLAPLIGPVLGLELPATDASQAIEPESVPAARAEIVCRLLRDPPGLLVVEDAHWLDPATLDLLRTIAEPLADGWLVVVARRPDTAAVAALGRSLQLGPLADDEIGRLAVAASGDRALSDAVLDAIVERAGGNPLFAAQLARSPPAVGDVGLPESAERVIGARIDLLPGPVRTRLRNASVLGRRAELAVLSAVTDDPEVEDLGVWASLDEFVDCSPNHVEFRHDLFRLAAYEGLSFSERSRLHRRAADVLAARPATPAAVLAEHSVHAGRPHDVVRWAKLAADEAAAGAAFVDEVRLRGLAAAHARAAGVDDAERTSLFTALGQGNEMLGEVDAAERAYRQALRSASPAEQASIKTRLAWLAFRNDELPRARGRVSAALRVLPPDGVDAETARAELVVLRSAIRGVAGDRRRSDADARWVEKEAVRLGSDELRGEALMQLAFNADVTDDSDVEELIAAAVTLLEGAGRRRDVAILHLNRGVTHMVRGRWRDGLASFDVAAEGFRRCGFVLGSLSTDANRGGLLLEQGDPAAAVELFDDVVRRARAAGNNRKAIFALGSAHRARAWMGDAVDAVSGLAECVRELNDLGHRSEVDGLDGYLVEVLVLAGRFDEAGERAASLLPRLADRSSEVEVLTARRLAAIAKYFMGDAAALDELRQVLDDARDDQCAIEIARCLQALELLSPSIDEGWAEERERHCRALGVTWMPPITFVAAEG